MLSEMNKLGATLSSLLLSWWQLDRVRISPREGLLLRLRPPCWIVIATQRVQIATRRVLSDSAVPTIIYDCQTESGVAKLCVEVLDQGRDVRVRWYAGESVIASSYQELSPDDIEVYG